LFHNELTVLERGKKHLNTNDVAFLQSHYTITAAVDNSWLEYQRDAQKSGRTCTDGHTTLQRQCKRGRPSNSWKTTSKETHVWSRPVSDVQHDTTWRRGNGVKAWCGWLERWCVL